jgi:hypothetical protein
MKSTREVIFSAPWMLGAPVFWGAGHAGVRSCRASFSQATTARRSTVLSPGQHGEIEIGASARHAHYRDIITANAVDQVSLKERTRNTGVKILAIRSQVRMPT